MSANRVNHREQRARTHDDVAGGRSRQRTSGVLTSTGWAPAGRASDRRKQACRRRNASLSPRTESLGAHPQVNAGRVDRFKEARGDISLF
jgi:hypothetical protein